MKLTTLLESQTPVADWLAQHIKSVSNRAGVFQAVESPQSIMFDTKYLDDVGNVLDNFFDDQRLETPYPIVDQNGKRVIIRRSIFDANISSADINYLKRMPFSNDAWVLKAVNMPSLDGMLDGINQQDAFVSVLVLDCPSMTKIGNFGQNLRCSAAVVVNGSNLTTYDGLDQFICFGDDTGNVDLYLPILHKQFILPKITSNIALLSHSILCVGVSMEDAFDNIVVPLMHYNAKHNTAWCFAENTNADVFSELLYSSAKQYRGGTAMMSEFKAGSPVERDDILGDLYSDFELWWNSPK